MIEDVGLKCIVGEFNFSLYWYIFKITPDN